MLVIQGHFHDGHTQISTEGLPRDAKVVVVFLDVEAANASNSLSPDQQVAFHLQSQNSFAQAVLLNHAEDCWNNA